MNEIGLGTIALLDCAIARHDHLLDTLRHTLHQIMERIRAEYREMPDMRLRPEQVQRLCGIEGAMCKEALDALVDAKFLRVRSDGSYVRGVDQSVPGPRS